MRLVKEENLIPGRCYYTINKRIKLKFIGFDNTYLITKSTKWIIIFDTAGLRGSPDGFLYLSPNCTEWYAEDTFLFGR